MTNIAVPQRVRRCGLPAQPCLGAGAGAYRDAVQARLAQQLTHGAGLDRAHIKAPVGFECAHDQPSRGARMLAPDVAEQLFQLWREAATATTITAAARLQRRQTTAPIRVQPALES